MGIAVLYINLKILARSSSKLHLKKFFSLITEAKLFKCILGIAESSFVTELTFGYFVIIFQTIVAVLNSTLK